MKINYCLPIIKKTRKEILEMIQNNIDSYQFFEVWLDYINDLDEIFVKNLCQQFSNKVIFLFRRKNLEEIKMGFEKRVKIISLISDSKSYLDLDIIQQKKELEHIEKNNLDLHTIISYHNYKETPTSEKLYEIIDQIIIHNPTILKISCVCNTEEDSKILLDTISELKNRKIKFIVSGMGEFGTIVKVKGALLGNVMTFAPLNIDGSSAPGQSTKTQLETIFSTLDN